MRGMTLKVLVLTLIGTPGHIRGSGCRRRPH